MDSLAELVRCDAVSTCERRPEVMVDDDWLRLYRKLIKSQVFKNEGLLKVWIWCLCKASWCERWVSIGTGRSTTERQIKPGQFIYGRKAAAMQLDMKPSTVESRMRKLEAMENLDRQSDTHCTVVTICHWPTYQQPAEADRQRLVGENAHNQPHPLVNGQNLDNHVDSHVDSHAPALADGRGATCGDTSAAVQQPKQQPKQQRPDTQPTPNRQRPDTIKKVKKDKKVEEKRKAPVRFDDFWDAYARKVGGKHKAQEAYARAVFKVTIEQDISGVLAEEYIITRARVFSKSPAGLSAGRHCPYPASWLNAGQFDDDPTEWQKAGEDQDGRTSTNPGRGDGGSREGRKGARSVQV